jgi:signal transduction histidine kinase
VTTWEWRAAPVWWVRTRSIAALVAIGVGVVLSRPRPALTGPGRWTALLLLAVAAGWLLWMFGHGRYTYAGLVLAGTAGVGLSLTNPASPALAYPAVICLQAGVRMSPRWATTFAAALGVLFVLGLSATHGSAIRLVVGLFALALGLGTGLIRRQNTLLHEEAQRARAEETVLAERTRIAREIHDVLAHALAALSVQLELADALLERGKPDQARTSVVRAGQLAREGLAETRRAIGALRGEALPLPTLLDALVTAYRTDLSAPGRVTVDGAPGDLDPDTALALYRTAQEAITNVRKHAPGAAVSVSLSYEPDAVCLTVHNGQSVAVPQEKDSGGYGLAGLRERAELVGGRFEAGPDGDGWRVGVRIPL